MAEMKELEPTKAPMEEEVYATIIGIELDYEHFATIKSATDWMKTQPELDDLVERRNFRLRLKNSRNLRADEDKVFAYYSPDYWRAIHFTTYRPDKHVIYHKQMTKARYSRDEVPDKSAATIRRELAAEDAKKVLESKREERKAAQAETRKKRKERERIVRAEVQAKLKAEGLDLDQDKPIRKRKKVEVELTRAQLED